MRPLLLFVILLAFSIEKTQAQNAYYDALFCASLVPQDADDYPDANLSGGDKVILGQLKSFLTQPFANQPPDITRVKQIFLKIQNAQQTNLMASGLGGMGLLSLAPSLLNLSKLSGAQVDTLLYGITVYFAEEFRKGYMQTYMDGIGKTIGKQKDLQVLFPATYNKILTYDPIRYKDFGNEMKKVFDTDLSSMPENIINQLEYEKIKGCKILNADFATQLKAKEVYHFFDMSAITAQKLINGVHPSDIIGHLDEHYYGNPTLMKKEMFDAIHLINLIQRNLRDTSAATEGKYANVWINFDKLSKIKSPKAMAYFIAFLYHQDKTFVEQLFTGTEFTALKINPTDESNADDIKALIENYNTFKTKRVSQTLSILVKIDELIKLKDKSLTEEQNFEAHLKNVGEILKLAADMAVKSDRTSITKESVQQLVDISSNVFHIYNDIRVKNYSNLPLYLFNTFTLLYNNVEKIAPGVDFYEKDSILNIIKKRKAKDYIKFSDLSSLIHVTYSPDMDAKQLSNLIRVKKVEDFMVKANGKDSIPKYELEEFLRQNDISELFKTVDGISGFASAIVSAKTSEEVNDAIKKYADPPASFITKRDGKFHLILGGMPGLSLGMEQLVGKKGVFKPVVGLTLPIGLDITFKRKKANAKWSNGLFIQLIDLGSMLNYRLTTQESTLPDKIGLDAVFSPGAAFSFGFPKTPWTFQLGYQRGPKLRKVTTEAVTTELVQSNIINFRLVYDIPLKKIL